MKRHFFIYFRIFLLVTGLFVTGGYSYAQTIEQLQKEIRAAEEEIKITNDLLNKTQADRNNNRSQLTLVRNNINNRKKIVSNLDNQIKLINRDVNSKGSTVGKLETELKELKQEYAVMLKSSYKNYRLNNFMAFLFAANDFNDASRRIYYMKRYTLMREKKAAQIDSLTVRLTADITDLTSKKTTLDSTVSLRNTELKKLGTEEQNYRKIDTSLGSKATTYSRQLAQKRKTIDNLQSQIKRIIAEESRKSQGTKRTTAETEAFVALSGRFDQNKGKLPYPVSGGVIIDRYGAHAHPTQKGLMINNTGVNIATTKGANVRAVFDGEVTKLFNVPGLNTCVFIRHGNYVTVYSNLETVSVKLGDKVATNQTIGKVYSGSDADNQMLHFEIWKETENLNPEQWLRR